MHARRPLKPETRRGRHAGWAALAAVLALLIANTALADSSGVLEAMRVATIVAFAASSVTALVLAVLSLTRGDRSIVVWASLVLGALVTALLLAEFTIME